MNNNLYFFYPPFNSNSALKWLIETPFYKRYLLDQTATDKATITNQDIKILTYDEI